MVQRYIKVSISENFNKEILQRTSIFNISAYKRPESTYFSAIYT